MMKFKKAIVTGAAGFIGSHLTRRLRGQGVDVLAVDNFSNVPDHRLAFLMPDQPGAVKEVNVLNRSEFGKAIDAFGNADAFFDLAYINGTKQFYERPLEILSHAGKHAPESHYWVEKMKARWVYFSTPEIYGEPGVVPTPEDHRILISDVKNMRFSYAIGKFFTESFIHAARTADPELDAVIVRPNNTYGATDRFHVISDLMDRIIAGKDLIIQGSGEETRSFCYVDDMVDQILLIYEKGTAGEAYSMGSQEEVTIKTLVENLRDVTGYSKGISFSPLAHGSPKRRCPDLTKVKSLGAKTARPLRDGLELTWKIEKDYRGKQQLVF